MPVALAALAAACSDDEPRAHSGQPRPSAPTGASPSTAEEPISEAKLAKLARFLDEAKTIHRVGGRRAIRFEGTRHRGRPAPTGRAERRRRTRGLRLAAARVRRSTLVLSQLFVVRGVPGSFCYINRASRNSTTAAPNRIES
jgi:hypothetical protein